MRRFCISLCAVILLAEPFNRLDAAFHLMQIEQVIGGVNGDKTAQAIQLRMRNAGQDVLQNAKLEVANAAGAGHILLERFPDNSSTILANASAGDRILVATANFASYTNPPVVPDFIMDPIPEAYLTNGRLTFRTDSATLGGGVVWWSLAWDDPAAPAYTGSHTGDTDNHTCNAATCSFGPAFPQELPTAGVQALKYTAATTFATSNSADYTLTPGAAVFTNNARNNFTVTIPAPPVTPGDFNDDGVVDAADYVVWKKTEGTNFDLGGNGDETGGSANIVDAADYTLWTKNFGNTAGYGATAPVPEPISLFALLLISLDVRRHYRRVS